MYHPKKTMKNEKENKLSKRLLIDNESVRAITVMNKFY